MPIMKIILNYRRTHSAHGASTKSNANSTFDTYREFFPQVELIEVAKMKNQS